MSLLNLILICKDSYSHRGLVPFSQITSFYSFVFMCVYVHECVCVCVYMENTYTHHLPVDSNAYLKWTGSSHLKDKVYVFILNPSLISQQHCFSLQCFFFFSSNLWTCGLLYGSVLRYMGRETGGHLSASSWPWLYTWLDRVLSQGQSFVAPHLDWVPNMVIKSSTLLCSLSHVF